MHAFFPVYFKAFYSTESIFEVTPNPKQMEDNEEKTESQSIIIIFNTLLGMNNLSSCALTENSQDTGSHFSASVYSITNTSVL